MIGTEAIRIPTAVAAPRPPLNLRWTGKLCPAKAAAPAIISIPVSSTNTIAKTITRAPLMMSMAPTATPALAPTFRKTLAAPLLKSPICQISWPRI